MKKKIDYIWVVLLLAVPIVLWILPADYFDNGEIILCPSRFLFGIECFGCGMTRAIMHIHHFNFVEGFYFNYFSFLIYPLLIIVWFSWMLKALNRMGIVEDALLLKLKLKKISK